jgi:hypothetical protein
MKEPFCKEQEMKGKSLKKFSPPQSLNTTTEKRIMIVRCETYDQVGDHLKSQVN